MVQTVHRTGFMKYYLNLTSLRVFIKTHTTLIHENSNL